MNRLGDLFAGLTPIKVKRCSERLKMNWKQFKKQVLEQNECVTFIDKQKANRGLNEVRFLRFFFCNNFKPYVDFYNAIGFYVIIEKGYYRKDYDLAEY